MDNKSEPYVLFEVAGSTYGLPSRNVLHLEVYEQATLVPNANPALDGVVFTRGQVLPVLNLRLRFGFQREDRTLRSRIIFIKVRERTVGLIVDSAREFINLAEHSIRPIEEALTGINQKYLSGVTQLGTRLILIPDLEAVLDLRELETITEPTDKGMIN